MESSFTQVMRPLHHFVWYFVAVAICGEQFLATLFIFKIFFQIIRCLCGWSGKAYKGPYAKNKKISLAPNALEIIS